MSQALIRAMGGSIWCESSPGKGAMFGIRLPLAKSGSRTGSAAV
jgi:signal transduction histidine kinase